MKSIFIAGISYNLSNADLGELFEEFGEVISAKIVMDRETGRSKGFGFVEMPMTKREMLPSQH